MKHNSYISASETRRRGVDVPLAGAHAVKMGTQKNITQHVDVGCKLSDTTKFSKYLLIILLEDKNKSNTFWKVLKFGWNVLFI